MNLKEMVDETLQSGVTPIVLDYEDVRFFTTENHVVRSFMVLNSLDLGTLTMKEYRFVARRTKQGDHMIRRHIEKLVRAIPKLCEQNPKVECFTIPTYARLLKGGVLAGMLFDAFTLYPDTPANKLCIELSADILYEDMEETVERVEELRKMGVKIAISELGDEFCPVFRLATLKVDYAFLDSYATDSLDREDAERVAGSLVKYLHYLEVKVIAPGLDSEDKITVAKAMECDGYTVAAPAPEAEPLPIDGDAVIEEIPLEASEEADEETTAEAEDAKIVENEAGEEGSES